MRGLLVGNSNIKIDNISAAQLSPFFSNRWQLYREAGLRFRHIQQHSFPKIYENCKEKKADIFFIRPDWRESSTEAEKNIRLIRFENPEAKIIFLDPFDQTSSRYFNVLPYVDKFLKYQCLKDTSQYSRKFIGGSFLTDYLVKNFNYDLNGWEVGSQAPEEYQSRIGSYWNFATAKNFDRRLQKPAPKSSEKDIDIFCRLSFGPPDQMEWYGQYRLAAVKALSPLKEHYKLAVDFSPEEARLVSRKQYLDEIKRSRIVFSPFGWGEVTWRDYEAACYGCLLIKPSVDHIDTNPNIFFPGVTYVPVRWDFQDLEEKCLYYVNHPDEASQIVKNARQIYAKFFREKEFVRVVKNLAVA